MKRVMLDTNAIDRIADCPGLLDAICDAGSLGEIVFVVTHIQEDELSEIRDDDRRLSLLDVLDKLPQERVPTDGFVLDYSRLGEARIGDGGWTGVSVDDLDSPGWRHRRDAVIGTTASGEADVLVTNDGRLARRMTSAGAPCEVWNFEQFKSYREPRDLRQKRARRSGMPAHGFAGW